MTLIALHEENSSDSSARVVLMKESGGAISVVSEAVSTALDIADSEASGSFFAAIPSTVTSVIIYDIDTATESISTEKSFSPGGTFNYLSVAPDGEHIAFQDTSGVLRVFKYDGTSFTFIDSINIDTASNTPHPDIVWNSDSTLIIARSGRGSGFSYRVVSFDGTAITNIGFFGDSIPAGTGMALSNDEVLLFVSDSDAGNTKVYDFNSATGAITLSSSTTGLGKLSIGTRNLVASFDASGVSVTEFESPTFSSTATASADHSQINGSGGFNFSDIQQLKFNQNQFAGPSDLFTYSAGSLVAISYPDTASTTTHGVSIVKGTAPIGPTTPKEKFNASYADASAADPKVTALIRPADVQRSIDTDVSNLKDGPNLYTVEAIFDIGELENLNPYNSTTEKPRVFFVKDDQPGLRQGKNLLLKSYTIRDADPAVPVTCTFWG